VFVVFVRRKSEIIKETKTELHIKVFSCELGEFLSVI